MPHRVERLRKVLDNNRVWADNRLREDPDYFKRLQAQQAPEYFWIGCADSRVPVSGWGQGRAEGRGMWAYRQFRDDWPTYREAGGFQ